VRPAFRLPLISALLLVFSLAAVTAQAPAQVESDPLSSLWRRPVPGVVSVFVSPDGARAFTVTGVGEVTCFDGLGTPVWTRQLPGVDRIAASRGGRLVAAYAMRRPIHRQVHFLDVHGEPFFTVENTGPVQSVAVAADGKLVAISAGKSITLCSRDGDTVNQRKIDLEGEITNVQLGPADTIYVAARNPDYVALVKSTGKVLWKRSSATGAGFAIAASEDGKVLGIGSQRPDDVVAVTLVNSRNERLWSAPRPGRAPRVRVAMDGSAVLLAYEHKVKHRLDSRFERRLAYFGRTSTESWTKGGAFNAPLCVAMDRAGDWVVVLDVQRSSEGPRFRLYGERGERRWLHTFEAPVLIAAGSAEGRHVAVYRADGVLELIAVTP